MKKTRLAFLTAFILSGLPAWSSTSLTVGTTNDGTGTSPLTLRAAINQANNDSTASHFPYFITLPAGTYSLTQGELVAGQTSANYGGTLTIGTGLGSNIVFLGAGASSTIITQSDGSSRVFILDAAGAGGETFTFSGVTIAGGNDTFNDAYGTDGLGGGGIFSGDEGLAGSAGPDKLFLTNCIFANNKAGIGESTEGGGAAILNYGGSVYMTNCIFTNNAVNRSASLNAAGNLFGGAVGFESADSGDTLTAVGCLFVSNSLTSPNPTHAADNEQAAGGALALYTIQSGVDGPPTTLRMTNCVFAGNSVTDNKASSGSLGGGALYVGGTAYVIGCTFTNNAGNGTANLGGAISQGTTVNDSTGDFSLSYNPATIPASTIAYTIAYSYAGDASLIGITNSSTTLTVTQAVPQITWTNPAPILYGSLLTTNQLNASANVAGTFVYSPTNGTALNTGTNTLTAIFTPTDTVDYTGSTNTVNVVVQPAWLTVTAANTNRVYGQTNPIFTGSITGVTNSDNITAAYSSSATSASAAGTYNITPSLVDPANRQTNYAVNLVNGTLTVTQAVPKSPGPTRLRSFTGRC